MTAEQQTKIQQTMLSSSNVHRMDRAGFSVSVGTAVPRSISLVDVPPAVVDIYPQWRGDSYVVVRDEIVIVDHRRKIVAVIPAGSSRSDINGSSSRSGVASAGAADLNGDDIREVQTVLIQGGFLEGEADGIYGPRTRQALIKFQRERGIQPTGSIDMRTVETMNLSGKVNVQRGATKGQASTTGSGMHQRSGQQGEQANGQASPQPSQEPSTTGQGGGALNPSENNRAPAAQSTTGSSDQRHSAGQRSTLCAWPGKQSLKWRSIEQVTSDLLT